jgi:hypothetical protein
MPTKSATTNLNVTDMNQVAAEAAREISADLRVAGVVLSASGSEYAEVLVNVEGCGKENCQTETAAAGVTRTSRSHLTRALPDTSKLV